MAAGSLRPTDWCSPDRLVPVFTSLVRSWLLLIGVLRAPRSQFVLLCSRPARLLCRCITPGFGSWLQLIGVLQAPCFRLRSASLIFALTLWLLAPLILTIYRQLAAAILLTDGTFAHLLVQVVPPLQLDLPSLTLGRTFCFLLTATTFL